MQNKQIEQWFSEYSDDIYHYLVYFTGNREVEDLVQDVFVKAMRSFNQYTGQSTPKTWLISIARNTAIDFQRRQKRSRWLPDEILNLFTSRDYIPEKDLELKLEVEELYRGINQLKRSYREVLLLRGINECTIAQTAEILNWSESKVKITTHRAIKALQNVMMGGE